MTKLNKKMMTLSFTILVFVCFCIHCSQSDIELKSISKDFFDIGVAVGDEYYKDEAIAAIVKKHFASIVPENQMKWENIQPENGHFSFEEMDHLVRFADRNELKVFGHTLCWHAQTPAWIFQNEMNATVNAKQLSERMSKHITTIMARYKGKVHGYDVVNEAINDSSKSSGILRNSPFSRIMGYDFVINAFKFANKADPEAELYYNDYNLTDSLKLRRTIKLVKILIDSGCRLDAVGMQGHWNIYEPSIESIENSILLLSQAGVNVMITELDLSVFHTDDYRDAYPFSLPDDIVSRQTKRYEELFTLFAKHSDKISRVTLWSANDRYSWLNHWPVERTNHPVLFDRFNKPKPAFFAITDVMQKHSINDDQQ